MAETKSIRLVFAGADEDRTIVWPCRINVPVDGGKIEVQSIDAAFAIPTPEELQEYQVGLQIVGWKKNLDMLNTHLKGFPTLKDEDDQDVDFETAKAALLKRPYAVDGLVAGLVEMARGRVAKN